MKNKRFSVEAGKLMQDREVLETFTKAGAPETDVAVAKIGKADHMAKGGRRTGTRGSEGGEMPSDDLF